VGSFQHREVDLAVSSEVQYLISGQKVRDVAKLFKNVIEIYQSENCKVSFARLL